MHRYKLHPASFKDPSGFIFESEGTLYRQVNSVYAENYDLLMSSGLYNFLTDRKYLIPHTEIDENFTGRPEWYKTLLPEKINFISYPYEWCFQQLKDAAMLTLNILRSSLDFGMILKDATPYNIQFHNGAPVFIDTLSFEKYDPSQPWVAYRQFCTNFLFPLYLEFYLHTDIQKIMSAYMDGIPVDITSRLLPLKSGLNLGVWLHVYLQNSVKGNDKNEKETAHFNKKKLLNLVVHLESIIGGFNQKPVRSTWSNYYEETILGKEYLQQKENIFRELVKGVEAECVLDIGGNDGHFTKILAEQFSQVVSIDSDSRSISKLYDYIRKSKAANITPLVIDVANPSPALGFNNRERASFNQRVQAGFVLALALVHHLVIGNNISLPMLASYFNDIAPQLLIEFASKEDEKVRQMLATRQDVFYDYDEQHFEMYFSEYFHITNKVAIPGSNRTMYLMKRIS
jgi:hypothetical protein